MTMHSELVALDDSTLETVAGGFFFPPLKKVEVNVKVQTNAVAITGSTLQANGNIDITQSNS